MCVEERGGEEKWSRQKEWNIQRPRGKRELCLGKMQISQMAIAEFESGKIVIKEARDL